MSIAGIQGGGQTYKRETFVAPIADTPIEVQSRQGGMLEPWALLELFGN